MHNSQQTVKKAKAANQTKPQLLLEVLGGFIYPWLQANHTMKKDAVVVDN